MRIVLGTAGLAAFSALVAAIVLPPNPVVQTPVTFDQGAVPGAPGAAAPQRAIQYVQLQPGQTAPPGATVVDSSAQPPPAAAAVPAAPVKPIIIRTTQSGKVLP